MSKLKYIIDINCFIPNSGGIVALHKLCHDLRQIGEESYVLSRTTHPLIDAPFLGDRRFAQQETVVVYPEIVAGNPHNCKNVVRWALNTPGTCSNSRAEDFYSAKKSTDLIFKYSDYFHLRDETESRGILTTTFVDKNIFYSTNAHKRGTAFFVKKGGMPKSVHPADSIDLSKHEHNWKHMASVLQQVEYFYCYDNACFWVVLAALCGCIPIVVPDSDMSASEWYSKFPHKECGVAYGIDMIQHARDTQHLVQDNLQKFYNKQLDTVRNFVKICETSFV
jgi:hypothetical protein